MNNKISVDLMNKKCCWDTGDWLRSCLSHCSVE